MILTAIAAVTLAGLQIEDLSIQGSSLAEAVDTIEKITGTTISVDKGARNQVVAIQVSGVSTEGLLKGLADVTSTSLVKSGSGYRLKFTRTEERRAEKEDRAQREDEIKAALKEISSLLELSKPYDSTLRTRQPSRNLSRYGFNMSHDSRAIAELLNAIGAKELSELEGGRRVVYGIRTTAMQEPMPRGGAKVIEQLISTQIAQENNRTSSNRFLANTSLTLKSATHGLISVRRSGNRYLCTIHALNDQNVSLRQWSKNIQLEPVDGGDSEVPKLENNDPFTFGDFSGRMMAMVSGVNRSTGGLPGQDPADGIDKDLLAALTTPSQTEPLSWFVGPALTKAAEAGGLNLIASIPDSAYHYAALSLSRSQASPSRVFTSAQSSWGMEAVSSGSFYLMRPKYSTDGLLNRTDRTALEYLSKDAVAWGALTLDSLARYAKTSTIASFGGNFTTIYMSAFGRDVSTSVRSNSRNREALILYSILGESGVKQAQQDKGIRLQYAPGFAKESTELVYHSQDGPSVVRSFQINRQLGAANRILINPRPSTGGGQITPPPRERTLILDSGVPANAVVKVSVRSENVLHAYGDDKRRNGVLSASQLGSQRAMHDSPANANRRQSMRSYSLFRPAKRTTINLRFEFAEGVTMSRSLTELLHVPGTKALVYAELPEDIRSEADKAYQSTLRSLSNRGQRRGGRGGG